MVFPQAAHATFMVVHYSAKIVPPNFAHELEMFSMTCFVLARSAQRALFAAVSISSLVGLGLIANAAEPTTKKDSLDHHISLGMMTPTPEMWFYDQAQQQYNNPKFIVRQKSEFAAHQRQQRLAAQTWYGMSRARPTANPTVHANGNYAPLYMPSRAGLPATQVNVVMTPMRSTSPW
jgi:hypothetical protein